MSEGSAGSAGSAGRAPAPAGSVGGVTLLDGPVGTELERRGLTLPAPLWSARAVIERPDLLRAIHAAYAAAGADVHTACTFRTTATALEGSGYAAHWSDLCARAVAACREGAGPGATVAGSIAPLRDCFTPQDTPDDATLAQQHAALARCLADSGCDLLLVETMPTRRELLAATRAAAATGLPTWAAVTCGPAGDFFDDEALAGARDAAADCGASAFLINCSSPARIRAALESRAWQRRAPAGLRLGAYPNALFGGAGAAEALEAEVAGWAEAGLTILGTCCGTGPEHLRALSDRVRSAPAG